MSGIMITSSQNELIKEIKSLKIKKNRERKKLFFIEGIRFVEEALKENVGLEKVFVSEQLYATKGGDEITAKIKASGFPTYMLSDKLFDEISDTENPQGILAVLKIRQYDLDNIISGNNFLLVLDSIQDPGNLGTIIRTADAAGANGIIMSKGCVDLYNPKVLRSTMGSVFHIPVCHSENLRDTLRSLTAKGIRVFAAHLKGNRNYFDVDYKKDTALIIGNEANGISDEAAGCADELIKIPMPGKSESLNASIAAGLLMYEVVRQRMQMID